MNVLMCYDNKNDSKRASEVAELLKSRGHNVRFAVNDTDLKWEEKIDSQLKKIDVSVILIGEETLSKYFIKYEVCDMANKNIPMLGLKVDKLLDENNKVSNAGNEMEIIGSKDGEQIAFQSLVGDIYDFVQDDANSNIQEWIESIFEQ